MSFNAFTLMAKLGLDSSEYDKGLNTAESSASSFGSAFGAVMGGVGIATAVAGTAITAVGTATVKTGKAIVDATSDVAEYGDEIDKMSQKVGLSAKAYQEWDYVMRISGTEMSNMTMGLKTLTNKFDDAMNGTDSAIETFNRLGLSMEDLRGLSREDLFATVITQFQSMEESAERAALANDLFGRSGQELAPLFNTSAEETAGLIEEVNRLGGVMSDEAVKSSAEFQDNLTAMNTAIEGLKRGIMSELLPSFSSLIDGFTKLISGEEGADEAIVSGIEKLVTGVGNIADKAVDILSEVFPRLITGFASRFPELMRSIINTMGEMIPLITDALNNDLIPAIMEILPELISSYMEDLPEMMQQTMDLYSQWFPMLIDLAVQLLTALANSYEQMMPIIEPMSIQLLTIIVNAILDNLPMIFDAAVAIALGVVKGIISMIPELVSAVVQIVVKLVATIIELIPHIIAAAVRIIVEFITTMVETAMKFLTGDYWKKMLNSIVESFTSIDWKGLGTMLTQGIANGIMGGITKIKDAVTSVSNGIKDKFTEIFGIHSPSKLFEYYGEMMMAGLDNGIGDGMDDVNAEIMGIGDNIDDTLSASVNVTHTNDYGVTSDINLVTAIVDALRQVAPEFATNVIVDANADSIVDVMVKANNESLASSGRGVLA